MFPLLPLAAGSAVLTVGIALRKKRKTKPFIMKLVGKQPHQQKNELQRLKEEVTARLMGVDERYHAFIQAHIDPLLGKTRNAQLQDILSEDALALSPEERNGNRRVGLGMFAVGLAILSQWTFGSLMYLAILVGFTSTLPTYHLAYQQWKETKQLTALQLVCIYALFLWFGGYATIAALGTLLLGIVFKIKAITENQSRNNLVNIFQFQPDKVWIRSNGSEVEIPFDQLESGDTLVLSAGQIVPVDGTIIAGLATVDQHMLTGEAQPVEKSVGDGVLASTLLISGQVDICVEKTGTETTAGQIEHILNETAQYKTTTALKITEITDRLALPTLALSTVSWPIIGPVGAVNLMLIWFTSWYSIFMIKALITVLLSVQIVIMLVDVHH